MTVGIVWKARIIIAFGDKADTKYKAGIRITPVERLWQHNVELESSTDRLEITKKIKTKRKKRTSGVVVG